MRRQCFLSSAFILALLIVFSGCASTVSSDTLVLEQQELSTLAEESAREFLKFHNPKNNKEYIFTIDEDTNESGGKIDIELIGRDFARVLRDTHRYFLSTSSGASKGESIKKLRKNRDDEEYNEDSKIEKGELLSPDLSLKIKIVKEDVEMDGRTATAKYIVLMSMEDARHGIVIWDKKEVVDKTVFLNEYAKKKKNEMKVAQKEKEKKEKKEEEPEDEGSRDNLVLLEVRAGIGQKNLPIYTDSESIAYSVGAKLGITHRWSSRYSLSVYAEYEASFQPYEVIQKRSYKEETFISHSVGLGMRMKMSFFYLSGGFLYDIQELNSDFFDEGYANINPYVGAGVMLGIDNFGFIIGGRYVFALGNGNYLNRGASADFGMYIGF